MPSDPNELREVDEHFSQLVAGVEDYAIFMLNREGTVLSWNSGAERIKGYKAHEIIGQSFNRFYPEEAIASGWPASELETAAQNGRFEDEGWRLRKDGSRFWANVVFTTLRNCDGSVRGFLKITRDLTERKEAEETLRESEERFRLLVDGVKDYAIFLLDPDGRVATWNTGAERIKGYSAQEIIGQHFSRFYSSEDVAAGKPKRELEIAIEKGSVEDEGWRVRKDRSQFWANVTITALYDSDGKFRGFAKVTRDMTDKRTVQALQTADRQKDEFLAMLAHELRNPLAPIRNGLQLIKLPNISESVMHDTTEMMERQMVHLVRLVDDLLDVSRIMTGKIVVHRAPVDLSTVVARAVEETAPFIDRGGHELLVTMPSRPIIVDGDVVRLAQVLSNLLTNAAKYSEKPGQVWLTVGREGDLATIRVRDAGVGIAAELLPNIFELFVQADHTLARTQGGLGIGLTLVKRIVEIHGGTVSASSAGRGQGSEFIVRLPFSTDLAAAEHKRASDGAAKRPARRILVVDDNVDAALTISALLRAWGHEVQVAHNGPSALETANRFRPQIILLDIGLPGMSGYEVARQLRKEPTFQGMVIAALTGYGQEEDRRRSFDAGFDYHVTKPPDPGILESMIASARRIETEVSRLES